MKAKNSILRSLCPKDENESDDYWRGFDFGKKFMLPEKGILLVLGMALGFIIGRML